MRIRTKLAIALAVPLVALIIVTTMLVGKYSDEADAAGARSDEISNQVELATASLGPSGIIGALAAERNTEALDVIGQLAAAGEDADPEANRVTTDEALESFTTAIAQRPQEVQDAYAPALEALEGLDEARSVRDGYTGAKSLDNATMGASVFDDYSQIIDTLFDANTRVALAVDDPELRNGARVIDLAARSEDYQTRLIRSLAFTIIIDGAVTTPAAVADATANLTRIEAYDEELSAAATGAYEEMVNTALNSEGTQGSRDLFARAIAGEAVDIGQILGEPATLGVTDIGVLGDEAAEQLQVDADSLRSAADQEKNDAESTNTLVLVLAGIVVLAAIALTLLLSTSITRPLRRLTIEAEDMAERRLPGTVQAILETPLGEDVQLPELAKVPTAGGAEIAEVANALNTVQASAADLAVEQAVLRRNISDSFVNLGRRNQNLLTRQLDSITEMERAETDPDELQKLFTLDHLATRMRRNAESLLLLAGLEPHRQWSAPVALIDVLRGALGEVEDYDRVRIDRLDEATIAGTAAADLTHMVAELLENALNFSPPGRDVEIVGRKAADGYQLFIVDNGVGMSAEAIEEANIRLAGAESFTVAPSRYLGHYVVGIQAARLGAHVSLNPTMTGGVTATIDITALLDSGEAPTGGSTSQGDVDQIVPTRVAEAAAVLDQAAAPAPSVAETAPQGSVDVSEETQLRGPAATSVVSEETTASGYKKRVRGANTPRTDVIAARGDDGSEDEAPEQDTSSAEGMRNLLSGFQQGTERGIADAHGSDETRER